MPGLPINRDALGRLGQQKRDCYPLNAVSCLGLGVLVNAPTHLHTCEVTVVGAVGVTLLVGLPLLWGRPCLML